jgi:hypothetical protein
MDKVQLRDSRHVCHRRQDTSNADFRILTEATVHWSAPVQWAEGTTLVNRCSQGAPLNSESVQYEYSKGIGATLPKIRRATDL